MHATYWWIVEDGAVLGAISLRHELNDFLLRARGHFGYGVRPSARRRGLATWALGTVLEEASGLGLDRVLVTCAESNLGSRRVISTCGGVLGDVRDTELGRTRRYWIEAHRRAMWRIPPSTTTPPLGRTPSASQAEGESSGGVVARAATAVGPGEADMFSEKIRFTGVMLAAALVATPLAAYGCGTPTLRAAPAPWDKALTLSIPGQPQAPTDSAVSADGAMAVTWMNLGDVTVARRTAGGTWAPTETVANYGFPSAVAYDGAGRLLVAWADDAPGLPARVRVRTHTPGVGWGAPHTVARRTAGILTVADLAVNSSGEAVLAWQWHKGGTSKGLVSRGSTTGTWATGLRVDDAVQLTVALGDGGLAATIVQRAVVDESSAADLRLQVARQPRGDDWSTFKVLRKLNDFGPPWPGTGGVFVDASGRTTVAWDNRADGTWQITAIRAKDGRPWGRPKVLQSRIGWGEFPVRVTGDQTGDVLVTYVPQMRNRTLQAVRRPSNAGWSAPVSVSGIGKYINDWDAAMDPTGRATALWTRSDGPGTPGRGVVAALMGTAGVWKDPQRLTNGETPDGHSRIAAMNHREALAAWSQLVGGELAVRVRTHS